MFNILSSTNIFHVWRRTYHTFYSMWCWTHTFLTINALSVRGLPSRSTIHPFIGKFMKDFQNYHSNAPAHWIIHFHPFIQKKTSSPISLNRREKNGCNDENILTRMWKMFQSFSLRRRHRPFQVCVRQSVWVVLYQSYVCVWVYEYVDPFWSVSSPSPYNIYSIKSSYVEQIWFIQFLISKRVATSCFALKICIFH